MGNMEKNIIGVNMITWNGEDFIKEALEAVLPYAEQVIVCDTGSTDETPKILKDLQEKYKHLVVWTKDIQFLGETRTESPKDWVLTALLEQMRKETKTEWILRVDDDEIFLPETMEEIQNLKGDNGVYAIELRHFKTYDTILNPDILRIKIVRLFKNNGNFRWSGHYGRETIVRGKKRMSSKYCPYLKNPFLHLGDLRKDERRHGYGYGKVTNDVIPTPEEYYKYLPKKYAKEQ